MIRIDYQTPILAINIRTEQLQVNDEMQLFSFNTRQSNAAMSKTGYNNLPLYIK